MCWLFNGPELVVGHTSILLRRPDNPLVLNPDAYGEESLFYQWPNADVNLAVAEAKEIGEGSVGSKATSLVVEAVNFDKEFFLHQ